MITKATFLRYFASLVVYCDRYKTEVRSKPQLKRELEDLQRQLEPLGSPVVFCHNDLLLGNIVYNDKKGRWQIALYPYLLAECIHIFNKNAMLPLLCDFTWQFLYSVLFCLQQFVDKYIKKYQFTYACKHLVICRYRLSCNYNKIHESQYVHHTGMLRGMQLLELKYGSK